VRRVHQANDPINDDVQLLVMPYVVFFGVLLESLIVSIMRSMPADQKILIH